MQDEELTFVLTRHWRQLGLNLDDADFTDAQAVATIVRITGGNFCLVHRLFVQIERILRINDLTTITVRWSRFPRQRHKVDLPMKRTIQHEDTQTVHGRVQGQGRA